MDIFEKLNDFITLAKELNYDISLIYAQDSNSIHVFALIILILLFGIALLINDRVKTKELLKLILEIKDTKNLEDYNNKLNNIVLELPKRGSKVASNLDLKKDEILKNHLFLLKSKNIKEKIDNFKQISISYSLISEILKKYNLEELSKYYSLKSKTILENNLFEEIEFFYKNSSFKKEDAVFVDEIISYANSSTNPSDIINPLFIQINRFNFGFNLDLYKFIKALDKNKSEKICSECNKKMDKLLNDEYGKISEVILSYMLENGEKQKVYSYISNLKDFRHLQSLYYNLFAKKDDIDLDLAFVKNKTKINSNYKEYLDKQITFNWRDLIYINHILKSPNVLEVLGHDDCRTILERVENLEKEASNNQTITQVLEVAKRAEAIAKEAKAIARSR